jgi:hypothetical protein
MRDQRICGEQPADSAADNGHLQSRIRHQLAIHPRANFDCIIATPELRASISH